MQTNQLGINLIKSFESLRLKPYLCPANVPTIGYGSTFYSDHTRVTLADKPITEMVANQLLLENLKTFEDGVTKYVKAKLNSNQFSSLVSFAYNLGVGNLASSTLLKLINKNPNDLAIAGEFMKWVNAGGKVLAGLQRRRQAEYELYSKGI